MNTIRYNIIFLDVDGVLNTLDDEFTYSNKTEKYPIDLDKIELVKKLIDDTGSKIVLSSSWRRSEERYNKISSLIDIYGVTNLRLYRNRLYHIYDWLNDNIDLIKNYIVFDDVYISSDTNFIQVNPMTGLTNEDIILAKNVLGYAPF